VDKARKEKIMDMIRIIGDSMPIAHLGYGIVSHPIIQNLHMPLESGEFIIVTDENKHLILEEKYKMLEKYDEVESILFHMNKPYRLQILALLKDLVEDSEFNKIFKSLWTSTEYPSNNNAKDLQYLFNRVNSKSIMTTEEFNLVKDLPDIVTVYRGLQGAKAKARAYSWTLNKDKANWFANRYQKGGKVLQAQIPRDAIYFYTDSRNEKEIVLNPRRLRNVQEIMIEVMPNGLRQS
jgi:hypothetical protein